MENTVVAFDIFKQLEGSWMGTIRLKNISMDYIRRIKEEGFAYCLRRPLVARLVEYALCAYLFSSAVFGTVVGSLWALGYLEMWLPPTW